MTEDHNTNNELVAPFGKGLVHWHVDEYPKHKRSTAWFITMSVIGLVLIIYAFATANLLFAVIILMIGIITLVSIYKEPEQVDVVITTTGLIVGDSYYEYSAVKDFSVVFDPPKTKVLYVDFETSWRPLLSIPLGTTDPNEVREHLLPYCVENLDRLEETLTDMVRRMYKF